MRKLPWILILSLPLLFAVETEKKFRMPIGIQNNDYGYVPKGDTNWVSFNFIEIDTLYSPTLIHYITTGHEKYPLPIPVDTFYAPKIIIEYKGQKFKIVLEPIIEEK